MDNLDQEEQAASLLSSPSTISLSEKQIVESRPRTILARWRLALEIVMACLILALTYNSTLIGKRDKSSPVPNFPKKEYTFVQDPRYVHENMFDSQEEKIHTLHNWIELSAEGRGYVKIPEAEAYDLPEPYMVNVNLNTVAPAYMMSSFHQLHCLSYLAEHYNIAPLSDELAHHSAHCFDYLRQSIMCSADTTLEGVSEAGPGWGGKHQCTDYEKLLEWANERTAVKWRGNLPTEAVL